MPHCSEAWDAISRYIYTGLQGGSIMKGWMKRENEMICCCSDGTRPVIFKIERIDEEQLWNKWDKRTLKHIGYEEDKVKQWRGNATTGLWCLSGGT